MALFRVTRTHFYGGIYFLDCFDHHVVPRQFQDGLLERRWYFFPTIQYKFHVPPPSASVLPPASSQRACHANTANGLLIFSKESARGTHKIMTIPLNNHIMAMNTDCCANVKMISAVIPRRRMDAARPCAEKTALPSSSVRCRSRGPGVLSLALPCILIAASTPNGRALSLSSTSVPSRPRVVNQARTIHGPKRAIKKARRSPPRKTKLLADEDAVSATFLFDDDVDLSLESSLASSKHQKNRPKTAQQCAEEFDRFMEEDASVSSIVRENVKPGSLVDSVQKFKGADVVNMETLMQREAADRRRRREAIAPVKSTLKNKLSSSRPEITRQSPTKGTNKSTPRLSPNKDTNKSGLLTKDQEYALARTIQAGASVHKLKAQYESSNGIPLSKRDWAKLAEMSPNELRKLVSDYRTAKQELVACNMGLVHAVVQRYSSKAKYRGVSFDELVQEGALGLIRAAELFDPEKGLRFSTYATIWIKGVLCNSKLLDDVVMVPSRDRALWNKVQGAWKDMVLEKGHTLSNGKARPAVSSAKDIAERLGMKRSLVENNIRRMACVTNVLSLDYQYTTTTRSGYAAGKRGALADSSQFATDADLAERAQLQTDVVAALVRTLSEKELTLMRLRYGLEDGTEYTVKECASKMGLNRETARLLHHACLKKLREASNMESLQEYLLTVA